MLHGTLIYHEMWVVKKEYEKKKLWKSLRNIVADDLES